MQFYKFMIGFYCQTSFSLLLLCQIISIIIQIPNNNIRIMSYKATVDIVIALNTFKISSFRRQGKLRFILSLSQFIPSQNKPQHAQFQETICTPYNIYKQNKDLHRSHVKGLGMSVVQQFMIKKTQSINDESFLDNNQECYYSRIFQSKYQTQSHFIQDCCFFKTYIDVDKLEETKLKMKIVLLFCPEEEDIYIELGSYESIVHKITNICTYFPAIFDQFGGFYLTGSYLSTIIDYKFDMYLNQKNKFNSFGQYFYAATQGLNRQKIQEFYNYYRRSLEAQLFHIQEKHSDFLRILNITSNYGFIKVGPNISLRHLLSFFQNTKGLSRSRSNENLLSIDHWHQKIADEIICDFNGLKGIIHQKWNEFIIFLAEHLDLVTNYVRKQYQGHVYQRLRTNVFSHQVQPKWDWTFSRYEDSGKQLLKQAQMDKQKNKDEQLWRQYFPIQNKSDFQEQGKTIKIFQQIYQGGYHRRTLTMQPTRKGSFDALSYSTVSNQADFHNYRSFSDLNFSKSVVEYPNHFNHNFSEKMIHFPQEKKFFAKSINYKMEEEVQSKVGSQHIIVFVHGYQASRQDFILFKSCLEIKYKCRVFISSANEGHTQESIQFLGKRLAVELNNFFKNVQFGPNTRLSFVGHSMGGIIIRSALSYIRNIQQYLWAYLSFSSPHLGYLYEPSALIQAGLWLLGTINKSESLDQLCMRDSSDPRKCLLYRLSENGSLDGFQYLAFISSSQDEYVPYESARIEKNSLLLSKLGESISVNVIREMVDGLLGQSRCRQISRMNVVFNIQGSNFDALVGRTAHIKYLSDHRFIKLFSTVFDKYFS